MMKNLDQLLAKLFQGTISETDKSELDRWLSEAEGNPSVVKQARKLWNELGFDCCAFTQDKQAAWEMMVASLKPDSVVTEKRSLSKLITKTVLIIVLLFIVMGIGITFLTGTANTVVKAVHRSQRVVLPDGTTAYLDSGTTIKYSKLFGSRNRTLKIDGEAIFEGVALQEQPLTIRTKMHKVEVAKGIVCVSARGDAITSVMAIRGNLKILFLGKQSLINEGDMASIDSSDHLAVVPIDLNLIAWRTDQLVASDTPLGKLIKPIEKLSHRRVVFSSTVDFGAPMTFTVKPITVRSVADTLAKRLKLNVRVDADAIVFF